MTHTQNSVKEALQSILPIAAIVLILSISIAPLHAGVLVLFLFGTILLIIGMSFFTIGSGISMEPLGEGIGIQLGKAKRKGISLILCLLLGVIITIAEPDLQVLAGQVPSIPNAVLILCVALGVGIFLVVSVLRVRKEFSLAKMLLLFYGVVIALAFFAPTDFVPTAFDSGGVTTGPITVPFIMAFGAGMAAKRGNKHSGEDSFGLVSLCSIGPILSVLVLSILYNPRPETSMTVLEEVRTTKEAFGQFLHAIPTYGKEVFVAVFPIIIVFFVFQSVSRRFHRHQLMKMGVGFVYTYLGLVLFLTGANVGFMPAGRLLGASIVETDYKYLLVPIGMIMGYFIVLAEPAVHSLKKQVVEVTNGAISQKSVGYALSIGVAASVGISMLRVLTEAPVLPFLIIGYMVSLGISFFVPPIYTGIAFDSGGVASGPMTTTFILPFAVGACEMLGGNIMTDAFGIVAMIAIAPLISIQILGLSSNIRKRRRIQKVYDEWMQIEDDIICFEEDL